MNNYKHLTWDSDFLGFKVAAVYADKINSDVDIILQNLNYENYRLVYFISENEVVFSNNASSLYKIKPIDVKLTYKAFVDDIIESNDCNNLVNVVNYSLMPANNDLIELAFQSGIYSRFKRDNDFAPNCYFSLYRIWLEKSLNRNIADEVFAYTENSKILGFITIVKCKDYGKIGLIAVAQEARGKNIGRKLILSGAKYLSDSKINTFYVATQNENHSACNFYRKIGFNLDKKEYYYHIWMLK